MYRHAFKSEPRQGRKRHFLPRTGHQCQVTAVFDDHVQSFSMRDGATLGELSERLALPGSREDDCLVAITIKLGPIDGKATTIRVHRPDVGHAPRYVM